MNITKLSNKDFADLLLVSCLIKTSYDTMKDIFRKKKESDRLEILSYIKLNSEEVYNTLTNDLINVTLNDLRLKVLELNFINRI